MPLYIISSGFQSTCPARGTTEASDGHYETQPFQSTCPARGTTAWHIVAAENLVISIHVPREGHDSISTTPRATRSHFNPRAPRGARPVRQLRLYCGADFNPRAPRGARRQAVDQYVVNKPISIHVPREGHDAATPYNARGRYTFQSTCPARGTTSGCLAN